MNDTGLRIQVFELEPLKRQTLPTARHGLETVGKNGSELKAERHFKKGKGNTTHIRLIYKNQMNPSTKSSVSNIKPSTSFHIRPGFNNN